MENDLSTPKPRLGMEQEIVSQIMNKVGAKTLNELALLVEASKINFLAAEPIRVWREDEGIISFPLISDDTSGPEWFFRLEKNGVKIFKYAAKVLNSRQFKTTSFYITDVAVLKGILFEEEHKLRNVKKMARDLGLFSLNSEDACLIREKLSDDDLLEMGLYWINPVHKPINGLMLYPSRYGLGNAMATHDCDPDYVYHRSTAFAFGKYRRKLTINEIEQRLVIHKTFGVIRF